MRLKQLPEATNKRGIKYFVKEKAFNLISKTGYCLKPLIVPKNDQEHYLKLYGKKSVEGRKFYNISAGGHFDFGCGIHHPCWTNIDLDREWKYGITFNPEKDIAHDILTCSPIPVESNSAELIYSRLSIEHITDEATLYMFKEAKRMLKKGGLFRVNTLNNYLDYIAFKNNDRDFFYWFKNHKAISIGQAFLEHFAASASLIVEEGASERITDEEMKHIFSTLHYEEAMEYCTSRCPVELQNKYRRRHINWWTPEKLEKMLKSAGFKTVYLSSAEQSMAPVLRNEYYFDNINNKTMLYMEAIND